jgi:DNA polymerase III subunit chi
VSSDLVRFYACEGDPVLVALRLVLKALEQGQRTWVQGAADALQRLSDALWLQPGFLAHAGPASPLEVLQLSRIALRQQAPPASLSVQLWIGLGVIQPIESLPAPRCFELLGPTEAERQTGRQRYRAYQALGLVPESVQVRAS